MKYCFLILITLIMFSSSCKISGSKEEDGHFTVLDSMIRVMESEMRPLQTEIKNLAVFSESLFSHNNLSVGDAFKTKYVWSEGGVFHNPFPDKSESSVYVSTFSSDSNSSIEEVYITEKMDSVFALIPKKYPMVCQVFYNSKLQFSRVYPSFDLFSSIETDMDITSFNFYYLGDELRNPDKSHVWLEEVYVDPVGRGWILSLIHPVYFQDLLMGVLGFDITLTDLMEAYLVNSDKKLFIIDGHGTIVAGNPSVIETLSMPPLKHHTYIQTVKSNNFRKEDFNLFKSKSKEVRRMASKFLLEKEGFYSSDSDNFSYNAYCRQMNLLNWYLIELDK